MDNMPKGKYREQCECCGHITVAYTHKLNKGLTVAFLERVLQYKAEQKRQAKFWVSLNPNTMAFTHNQKANWQKLRYLGLIIRNDIGWHPTIKGLMFADGERVHDKGFSFGNDIVTEGTPIWNAVFFDEKKRPKYVTARDILGGREYNKYKHRKDYQEEIPTPCETGEALFTPSHFDHAQHQKQSEEDCIV